MSHQQVMSGHFPESRASSCVVIAPECKHFQLQIIAKVVVYGMENPFG